MGVMKSAERFKRLVVKPIDVLPPFGILLTLNVILLLVWTINDPMYFSRTEPTAKGDGLSSTAKCYLGHGKVSLAMCSSLAVVSFLVVVLANVEAYKARNIATEFSESKYVAMIMVGVLQLIILGVPIVLLVAGTNPEVLYFMGSVIIFSLCMLLLLGIFAPKIVHMKEEASKRQHKLDNPPTASSYSHNPSTDTVSRRDGELRVLERYTISEEQIPELAESFGCESSDLKSMLNKLCTNNS